MALSVKKETEVVRLKLSKKSISKKFQVELYPDVSGSMQSYYRRGGVMETVLQRSLAFASVVDPDDVVQITPFSDVASCLGDFQIEAFDNIMEEFLSRCKSANSSLLWQGTDYEKPFTVTTTANEEKRSNGGLIGSLKNLFGFGKKPEPVQTQVVEDDYCTMIIFQTDGQNYGNASDFYNALSESTSDGKTYVVLMGVGDNSFSLLRTAASKYPGVDFVEVKDINKLNDESFYDLMITDKFAAWLNSK